jgi:enoyl-CoA hydratase/carnithine racemase
MYLNIVINSAAAAAAGWCYRLAGDFGYRFVLLRRCWGLGKIVVAAVGGCHLSAGSRLAAAAGLCASWMMASPLPSDY